jgi:hypothetical protein
MSQRSVWACDICGTDQPIADIRSLAGPTGVSTANPSVDIGVCCFGKPISDLLDTFKRKAQQVTS